MVTPALTAILKMIEDLPEPLQNQIADHLREYLSGLDDEEKWNETVAKSRTKLADVAREVTNQIAEGKSEPMEFNQTMKSATLPSFRDAYERLDQNSKECARKAFLLWAENPFYPSLCFKCIHPIENIWSIRITRGICAMGRLKEETVTWFWIGNQDDYKKFFG